MRQSGAWSPASSDGFVGVEQVLLGAKQRFGALLRVLHTTMWRSSDDRVVACFRRRKNVRRSEHRWVLSKLDALIQS